MHAFFGCVARAMIGGLLMFLVSGIASGTSILYVRGSAPPGGTGADWAHAFRNLEDALSAAAGLPGDKQVWVTSGTYRPSSIATPLASFNVPDATSVYGGFVGNESSPAQRNANARPTVLTGDLLGDDVADRANFRYASSRSDNAVHVVTIANNATVTLDTLTITGGNARYVAGSDITASVGGGIYVRSGGYYGTGTDIGLAHLTLSNVTVAGNIASRDAGAFDGGWGGGLWQLNGTLAIVGSTFDDNRSVDAGGAFIAGFFNVFRPGLPASILSQLLITDSKFTSNVDTGKVTDAGLGAGVLQSRTRSLRIENNVFARNTGIEGVFQLAYAAGGTPPFAALIQGNTFDRNGADLLSGGLQVLSRVSASSGKPLLTLRANTFTGNTSNNLGGALFASGAGSVILEGNTFSHNAAGVGGGAIYLDLATGDIAIDGCTFDHNAVAGSPFTTTMLTYQAYFGSFFSPALQPGGGAILLDDSVSRLTIGNSSFASNSAPIGGAISVAGYGWLQGEGWDYATGRLPDFSATALGVPNPAALTLLPGNTFHANEAKSGDGGAIFVGMVEQPAIPYLDGTFPAIAATGATSAVIAGAGFGQNHARRNGGAIAGEGTTMSIDQNAFQGNVANGVGDHLLLSGDMVNTYSTTTQPAAVLDSLTAGNSFRAPAAGAGIALQ